MNREVVRDIVDLQRTISQINDEIPDAALTLTRTAAQAITTAGTTIVWQSRIRGQGITWSGASITIPTPGWYHISVAFHHGALNDNLIRLGVNGVNVQFAPGIGDVNFDVSSAHFMRYFNLSDVIQISVLPSANVNINARAESGVAESPMLNIVQLTNQAEA